MGDVKIKNSSVKHVNVMQRNIKSAFSKVREELDDHRETINQNSGEMQSLYDYLFSLEQKIDKLGERVDMLTLDQPRYVVDELSYREQEVFLFVYMSDLPVSVAQIVQRLGFSEDAVYRYVARLVAKGVPLLQHEQDKMKYFSLELKFKDMHTKNNLVHIDEVVSQEIMKEEFV